MMHDLVQGKRSSEFERMARDLHLHLHYSDSYVCVDSPNEVKGKLLTIGSATKALIEHPRVPLLYPLDTEHARDSVHYRKGGVSQTLCNLAAAKDKIMIVDLSHLLSGNSILLGRTMQNIRLYRAAKLPWIIVSFATHPYMLRTEHDLWALLRELGAHGDEAKRATTLLSSVIAGRTFAQTI